MSEVGLTVMPADRVAGGGLPGLDRTKLAMGSVAFLLLTVGIFWYQFRRIQIGDGGPGWNQLRWGYFLLLLLALPIETVTSGLRVWLLCRVLQPGVGLWTCFKAEWANVAIAMLTPSQSGGGPGQIYMLSRGGTSVGTALTISLLSFAGTMVSLLCMGLYSLLVSSIEPTGPLFAGAVWALTSISAAMFLGAIWPGLFRVVLSAISRARHRMQGGSFPLHDWWRPGHDRTGPAVDRMGRVTARLVDILYAYRDDVRRFLRCGKATFAWVCLLSLVFLFSRCLIPYLCIRFLGIETSSLRGVIEVQMALIFLVFFAPTPGGAGVAEGASLSIMANIVPVGFAPYYNLLWRFSTLYLAAIAGLFCLLRALVQDAQQVLHKAG